VTPEPQAEVPARLRPVMESSGSSLGPLEFTPHDQPYADAPPADTSPLPDASTLAPVAWDAALADLTAPAAPPARPAPAEAAEADPLAVPTNAFLDPAPSAGAGMPEAISFEPPGDAGHGGGGPAAPVAFDGGRPSTPSRPFFLEDAAPPRPFGTDAP